MASNGNTNSIELNISESDIDPENVEESSELSQNSESRGAQQANGSRPTARTGLWEKVRRKFTTSRRAVRTTTQQENDMFDRFERACYIYENDDDFHCYESDSDNELEEPVFAVPAELFSPDAQGTRQPRRRKRNRLYMRVDAKPRNKTQRAETFSFSPKESKKGLIHKIRVPKLTGIDNFRGPCPCAKCQELWHDRHSKLSVFKRLGARPKERKTSDSYVFHSMNNSGCYDRIIEDNLLPGMRAPPPLPLRPISQRREMRLRTQSVPDSFGSPTDMPSFDQDVSDNVGCIHEANTSSSEGRQSSAGEQYNDNSQTSEFDSIAVVNNADKMEQQLLPNTGYVGYQPETSESTTENQPDNVQSDSNKTADAPETISNQQPTEVKLEGSSVPAKHHGTSYSFRNLAMCGWYWGPMSSKEAELELTKQPDGSFLVRDSANNCHLLSVSFRSRGLTCHTRIIYSNGKFSFFLDDKGEDSAVQLIEEAMKVSKTGILCHSRGHMWSDVSYPVRLVNPISRFSSTSRLQQLCRFVIRENVRCDQLNELPLPKSLIRYLRGNHYREPDR